MSASIEQRAKLDFIRYASVWEDADILCEALQPAPGKRMLSIASGGDNALALLAEGAEVVAVDLNPAQLALCELKRAAFRNLDYEEVLRFLGARPNPLRLATYQRLKGDVSVEARQFFAQHQDAIKAGIIHAGKFEHYFHVFRRKVLPWVHGREKVVRLLDVKSIDAQRAFYDKQWNGWRWRAMFRLFFSRAVMGRVGRDPEFFRFVEGSVADRILERTRYALTELPTASNPYLNYIVTGNFDSALPWYLRPEHYAAIRDGLDRLHLVAGGVEQVAEEHGPFDGFNLSDIFEYLDEARAEKIYHALVEHAAPGARLAYWNMLVPRGCPEGLQGRVRPLTDLSESLFAQDRAWFYSAFHVDEVGA